MQRLYSQAYTYADYREAFDSMLEKTSDPTKQNKFQNWLKEKFVVDEKPFFVGGIEVNRYRVGLLYLILGEEFKKANPGERIPAGFLQTTVLPQMAAELSGDSSITKTYVAEMVRC